MARLQDFNTVTPTDSDNLLVVQATGQGLATVGSTLGAKMDKANPTGTGSLSLNRKAGTGTGSNSSTLGSNNTASGVDSLAEGNTTTASGLRSHAEGYGCVSSGADSHAEGRSSQSSGELSHAQGLATVAQRKSQFVFGEWNIADTGGSADPPESGRGNYVEIVGNGNGSSSKSNARTLDWNGNEVLAGGLKVNGNQDVLAISSDYTSVAKNASATITMTKANGILIITRGRTAQIATISYYALAVHNGSYVNFELLTNTADNTVTLTTLGSRQLQISTTADYGISFRLLEF